MPSSSAALADGGHLEVAERLPADDALIFTLWRGNLQVGTRRGGGDRCHDNWIKGFQDREPVRRQFDDGQLPARQVLLVPQVFVGSDECVAIPFESGQ